MKYDLLVQQIERIEQTGDFKKPTIPLEIRLRCVDEVFLTREILLSDAKSNSQKVQLLDEMAAAVLDLAHCGDNEKARKYTEDFKFVEKKYMH